MNKLLLLLLIPSIALGARKLQNEDFKTEADITGAGGTAAQLLNDTKIYVTGGSINKTLDDAIADGDIGTSLTAKGNILGFGTANQECVMVKTDDYLLTVDSTKTCGFDFKPAPVSVTVSAAGELQTFTTVPASQAAPTANGQFLTANLSNPTKMEWSNTLSGAFNPVTDITVDNTCDDNWTNTTVTCNYKRVGDTMILYVRGAITGTPVGGDLAISIPTGFTIDQAKMITTAQAGMAIGSVLLMDNGLANWQGVVGHSNNSTTLLKVYEGSTSDNVKVGVPFTWAGNDEYTFTARIPITGWSSGVDAITQFKTFTTIEGRGNNGAAYTALTPINFTEVRDINGEFNGTDFVATETGDYSVDGNVSFTTTISTNIQAFIDGAIDKRLSENLSDSKHTFNGVVYLEAGETLSIRASTGGTLSNQPDTHTLNIVFQASRALVSAAIDSQKQVCETNVLTGDITADTNPVTDLTFTMVAGKKYSLSFQSAFAGSTTGTRNRFLLAAEDGANTIARSQFNDELITFTHEYAFSSRNDCFVASGTSLTFKTLGELGTATLYGDSSLDETFAQLCRLPDNYECN